MKTTTTALPRSLRPSALLANNTAKYNKALCLLTQVEHAAWDAYVAAYDKAATDYNDDGLAQIKTWNKVARLLGKRTAVALFWTWQKTLPWGQHSDVDPYGN